MICDRAIGKSLGKNACIGGGDMCVCAKDGRDAVIEIPAKRYFFGGRFGVYFGDDDGGGVVAFDVVDELIATSEGIIGGHGHEDAAQDGENVDPRKV